MCRAKLHRHAHACGHTHSLAHTQTAQHNTRAHTHAHTHTNTTRPLVGVSSDAGEGRAISGSEQLLNTGGKFSKSHVHTCIHTYFYIIHMFIYIQKRAVKLYKHIIPHTHTHTHTQSHTRTRR
jgi:hypothetical protein